MAICFPSEKYWWLESRIRHWFNLRYYYQTNLYDFIFALEGEKSGGGLGSALALQVLLV
jgi:hypothetical protein